MESSKFLFHPPFFNFFLGLLPLVHFSSFHVRSFFCSSSFFYKLLSYKCDFRFVFILSRLAIKLVTFNSISHKNLRINFGDQLSMLILLWTVISCIRSLFRYSTGSYALHKFHSTWQHSLLHPSFNLRSYKPKCP